ncbi:testis-expressed protein 10 homolog [Malaya genurostris]|uniref:testis-expressed protein 10 homolog n=1 Tax=Malaya genurostris TaxID=325434 RepID=UPI0026F39CD6|nr:testis-expressed protein 10 homolog [Malaya genurostris]
MGGNSRKFKKAEKSKIKLKGAKLPKGTNVTKTNFKVRKIVLPDQIKQRNLTDAIVLSNRSLTVKDCLAKLKHTNHTAKCDGLRGLREILSKLSTEVTDKYLSTAIKSVVSLSIDLEREVRRDCYKTLALLFASAGQGNIFPFFDVLLSFLRCTMTHIQPRIQEDSLLLLDTYLQYLPQLVLLNRDKIFPQFLDMISKLRNESKPERTLTLSLNKQSTSTKWRSRVLMRLIGMLKILIDQKMQGDERSLEHQTQKPMNTVEENNPFVTKTSAIMTRNVIVNHIYDVKCASHYSLVRYRLHEPCSLPFLFRKSIGEGKITLSDQIDEGRKLKTYVQMLMPLLFESWLEVRPVSSQGESAEHGLSNEGATTLNLLLDIVIQLWDLVILYGRETNNSDMTQWLRGQYTAQFNDHIIKGFPYYQNASASGSKSRSKEHPQNNEVRERNVDEKCYQQNFNICYLYCCLNENFRSDRSKNYEKVVNYAEHCINSWKFQSPELNAQLLKILRYMLLDTNCATVNQNTRGLLKTLLEVYIQAKLSQETRNHILILFCDIIVQNDRLWREYGQEIFTLWLRMLPNLLNKPSIDVNVLKALLCLAKQKNVVFVQSLEENIEGIMRNLPQIRVTNEQRENEGKILIINLIFWIENRDVLNKLLDKQRIKEIALNDELKTYFQNTLQSRFKYL